MQPFHKNPRMVQSAASPFAVSSFLEDSAQLLTSDEYYRDQVTRRKPVSPPGTPQSLSIKHSGSLSARLRLRSSREAASLPQVKTRPVCAGSCATCPPGAALHDRLRLPRSLNRGAKRLVRRLQSYDIQNRGWAFQLSPSRKTALPSRDPQDADGPSKMWVALTIPPPDTRECVQPAYSRMKTQTSPRQPPKRFLPQS